jgi:hypothetical protein
VGLCLEITHHTWGFGNGCFFGFGCVLVAVLCVGVGGFSYTYLKRHVGIVWCGCRSKLGAQNLAFIAVSCGLWVNCCIGDLQS